MGFYILSDGKGSYIHRDDSAGKYVQIRDYKKATQSSYFLNKTN